MSKVQSWDEVKQLEREDWLKLVEFEEMEFTAEQIEIVTRKIGNAATFKNCRFQGELDLRGVHVVASAMAFTQCTFPLKVRVGDTELTQLSFRSCEVQRGLEVTSSPKSGPWTALDLRACSLSGLVSIGPKRLIESVGVTTIYLLDLSDVVVNSNSKLEISNLRAGWVNLTGLSLEKEAALTVRAISQIAKSEVPERHRHLKKNVNGAFVSMKQISVADKAVGKVESVDLTNVEFGGTNLERWDFSNVSWPHDSGDYFLLEDRCLHEKLVSNPEAWPEQETRFAYAQLCQTYRQLVLNHEARRDYEAAERFHYGEMEMLRLGGERRYSTKLPGWLARAATSHSWYRWLSAYGTSWTLAALWLVAQILLFSLLFLISGLEPAADDKQGKPKPKIKCDLVLPTLPSSTTVTEFGRDYATALGTTLSIVTLQKQRLYEPRGVAGQMLSALLAVLVAGQTALLIFAIRRRFRRGSI